VILHVLGVSEGREREREIERERERERDSISTIREKKVFDFVDSDLGERLFFLSKSNFVSIEIQ